MWSLQRNRVKLNRVLTGIGFPRDFFLIPLAVVIGIMAGLVAMAFEKMVEFSGTHLFGPFYEEEQILFEGDQYVMLMILPAFGGLMVGLLTHVAKGKAGGHGIPDMIEALARKQGVLPKRSGPFKALTASLTIGSGGSAGVEGPIIQIGSVIGSATGQILGVGRHHMHTLVGCGAAAGMAAIFNAPIAGVLFVLEVLLRDFSLKTFTPIVIASVFGTLVMRTGLFGGEESSMALFTVSGEMASWEPHISEIIPFALLAALCAVIGAVFTRCMTITTNTWRRMKIHPIVKPALGGAILGVLGVIFMLLYGKVSTYNPPAFFSNGYPIIEWLFSETTYPTAPGNAAGDAGEILAATLGLLAVTLLFKIVGTCLTIGSGGSGGILAPSLFMGATVGGAFGLVLRHIGLFTDVHPGFYALAGMAGMFAANVHCPLTAFLLIFELTGDYKLILPVMLVAILATTFSQIIMRETVYAYWLSHLGMRMGKFSDTTVLRRLYVSQVKLTDAALVHPEEPAQRLLELAEVYAVTDYVVCDAEDHYVGMVIGQDVRTTLLQREALPLLIVSELMRDNLPTITPDQTLDIVLDCFARHDVASLPVVDDHGCVMGMITRSRLMQRYQQALDGD